MILDIAIRDCYGAKDRNLTTEEAIEEEKKILQISTDFQENQVEIARVRAIMNDTDKSQEEKVKALYTLRDAKANQLKIYMENEPLYEEYRSVAVKEYEEDGNDPATEHEKAMANSPEYKQNIENLKISIDNIESLIQVLEKPEILYKEGIASEGSKINDYLFEFQIFGQDINWTLSTTEVESLEYNPKIEVSEKEATAMDTKYTITENAVQKTNTTRKRISAIVDIFKRLITRKDVGDIYIFGKRIHTGKDIHGHDAEKGSAGKVGSVGKDLADDSEEI